jgi:hypothetical protein
VTGKKGLSMKTPDEFSFSDLTDQELVDGHIHYGDPDARQALWAEQRRRSDQTSGKQAKIANRISIAALGVAVASLLVSVIAFFR